MLIYYPCTHVLRCQTLPSFCRSQSRLRIHHVFAVLQVWFSNRRAKWRRHQRMNLLKSRRANAASAAGQGQVPSDASSPSNPSLWRHMGGENSAFKSLSHMSYNNNNNDDPEQHYPSSDESEEINVTTDDENSNSSYKKCRDEGQPQEDINIEDESRDAEERQTLRSLGAEERQTLRDNCWSLASFRNQTLPLPLPLTKYDNNRIM